MPPPRPLGRLGRASAAFLVLALGLVLAFSFVPPVATTIRTLALVPEMLQLPLRPLSALVPDPTVVTTSYGQPPDRLDLYLPAGARAGGRLPAVVVAFGIHPPPLEDPQIVNFARSLARLGVVVGVADSATLRATRISPDEPAHLADAILVVSDRPEVDPSRVGVSGFSAGASLAVMAAADPRVSPRLRFVSAFGGYASAELLLIDVASRTMELDGEIRAWFPDAGVRRDVLELFIGAIEPPAARQPLRDILGPIVASETSPGPGQPAPPAQFEGDALVAYRLFTATDREAARDALDDASTAIRHHLDRISPVTVARDVSAKVYVMHGENDNAIPVSHAVAIAGALPDGSLGRLTRFGRFEHGQPGAEGLGIEDAPDIWQLTLHLHAIVAAGTE